MKESIKNKIKKLPDNPGVYFFKKGRVILYIGKATSLRDRVKSYMSKTVFDTRGPLIEKMLGQFDDISFQKTDSVLEALILEAHLIKKHQPYANTAEKDDKSFNFVIITKEDFPRILIIRGRELEVSRSAPGMISQMPRALLDTNIAHSFGPFTNGAQLKEALKIVRKLFPYHDKCQPCDIHRNIHRKFLCKPCFNRQIGLCPGVCTGEISKKDYAKIIKNIVLFFEGNKKQILKNLQKEMKTFSHSQEYENAGRVKRQIFALGHIQDVALIKNNDPKSRTLGAENFRIESYDIAHMSGKNVVGVMTVVENGEVKKSDYRKFKIKSEENNDTKALSEILTRRLLHIEWPLPNLIVVDGGLAQKNAIEKIIRTNKLDIPVLSVVKDERHRPRKILGNFPLQNGKKYSDLEKEIILSNSEAHRFAIEYHKKIRNII